MYCLKIYIKNIVYNYKFKIFKNLNQTLTINISNDLITSYQIDVI